MLCAAAVNPATFLTDHTHAIRISKEPSPSPEGGGGAVEKAGRNVGVDEDGSMSMVWFITGVPNLTKVGG